MVFFSRKKNTGSVIEDEEANVNNYESINVEMSANKNNDMEFTITFQKNNDYTPQECKVLIPNLETLYKFTGVTGEKDKEELEKAHKTISNSEESAREYGKYQTPVEIMNALKTIFLKMKDFRDKIDETIKETHIDNYLYMNRNSSCVYKGGRRNRKTNRAKKSRKNEKHSADKN